MSRLGIPMYTATQHAYIWVTIEEDGKSSFGRWRGLSCKSIHRTIKKLHPNAHLYFGACVYITD
jgi:hypothetical protein